MRPVSMPITLKDLLESILASGKPLKISAFLTLATLVLTTGGSAQLQQASAKTPAVEDKLAESYHAMYDLKFQEAFKAADEAKTGCPHDTPPPFSRPSGGLFFFLFTA